MRKRRFTESQIIAILKEVESGRTGQEVCREHGVSEQTLYRWKKKYGGMEASDAKRLRELEEENRKLKRIVADLTVDNVALCALARRHRRAGYRQLTRMLRRRMGRVNHKRVHRLYRKHGLQVLVRRRPHGSLGGQTPNEFAAGLTS